MKPRYETKDPLPPADLCHKIAFNIMAEHVVKIATDFKERLPHETPDEMMPQDRAEYTWISRTWAIVQTSAIALVKEDKEKQQKPPAL